MHRLHPVRGRMPGRGHLRRGRRAGRPARVHRAQRPARQGVESHHRKQGPAARRRRMGPGQGQAEIPGTLNRLCGGGALPHFAARHLLDQHADRLPDLSGLTVLVPNHRAGQDFARVLARAAGRAALIPPRITPLKAWAEAALPGAGRAEPQARRLARLHGVLRRVDWLGAVDKWALTDELLQLADELSAARLGGAPQLPSPHTAGHPEGHEGANTGPTAIYGYALGTLSAIEQQFLERCAELAPLTLFEPAADADAVSLTLRQAWQTSEPPLRERADQLARRFAASPLQSRITLGAAPHLEAEARTVAAWVAEQLHAGRRELALIALDREAARRVRALLERMDVLVADETGWTLSTTAAAAVVDRWLECVAGDFPHVELLDLLKSPFVLGELALRQDRVLQFELALRRHGVSQGMADMQRLAHSEFAALPVWLAALFDARQGFEQRRAPLTAWLARVVESLARLDAVAPLKADAAGARVLETLDTLRRDLAADGEKYSFGEWRRWLNLALESASFVDARVASPVVLTSLPAARGRLFEAVAVIGADTRRLPPRLAPGLFSQATRTQLGLPTPAAEAAAATADLMQLLIQGPALLSWQAWHDDEPNPASPLVQRLQALHQAAWGTGLPEQASGEPP